MADFRAAERAAAVMAAGPTAPAVPQARMRRTRNPVVWGLVGGAAGAAVGAGAGALACAGNERAYCIPLAAVGGMSMGIPAGVHFSYGVGGPLVLTVPLSLGVAVAGAAVFFGAAETAPGISILALAGTPAAQFFISDWIEERHRAYAREGGVANEEAAGGDGE